MIAPGPADELLHSTAARRTVKDDDGWKRPFTFRFTNGRCDVNTVLRFDVRPLDRRIILAHHMNVLFVRKGIGFAVIADDFGTRSRSDERGRSGEEKDRSRECHGSIRGWWGQSRTKLR